VSTELEEAILTATGAAALVQKVISPVLLEYVRRYSPMVAAVPSDGWGSDQYYFNTRTALVPGGFVTDGGARPVGSSTYLQSSFQMRHLQAVGAITGYAEKVTSAQVGSLLQKEIQGTVKGLAWDIETAMDWGNSASTANGPYPQFDGLDTQCSTFSGNTQNAIDAGGASFSTGYLDVLVDLVESNMAEPVDNTDWMFALSSTANSMLSQILLSQQRFTNMVEISPGLIVPTYRNVPLVKSSFLSGKQVTMGTVSTTPATTGGVLAAGTFKYMVSAVMSRYGESLASAEASATVASGTTGVVTLSFSTPTGPDGAVPILYKVYRSATAGTETLLGYVDANVGLSGDGVTPIVTTSIIDNGTQLIPQNGSTQPAITPAAYVGTNAGHKPKLYDDVYLISRDSDNVLRPYVRDITPIDVYPTTAQPDAMPFALVTDTTLAVRAPKYMGRLRNVAATLSTGNPVMNTHSV